MRAVALALLCGLAACGTREPIAVSVQMTLDADSCGVSQPDELQLTCAATAGVWLRGVPEDDSLGDACVDFSEGAEHTLAELPLLLAGIDFSTAADRAVSIEMAVYGPWRLEADGCPSPDQLAGGPEAAAIIVRGSSEPVRLSRSTSELEVLLACGSPPATGETDPVCESQCTEQQGNCLGETGYSACLDARENCVEPCPPPDEDPCFDECEEASRECVAQTPEGPCEIAFFDCIEVCPLEDDQCNFECDDDFRACLNQTCNSLFAVCRDGCLTGAECASIAPVEQ